jgi:hypothetical protein
LDEEKKIRERRERTLSESGHKAAIHAAEVRGVIKMCCTDRTPVAKHVAFALQELSFWETDVTLGSSASMLLLCVFKGGPLIALVLRPHGEDDPDPNIGKGSYGDTVALLFGSFALIVRVGPRFTLGGLLGELMQGIAQGFAIPTSYGGARYSLWELEGRQVHLLGGSPHDQMEIYRGLSTCARVMSADGNMAQKMATQFAKFWQDGVWVPHPERKTNTPDLYLDCWRRSCTNIRRAWQRLVDLALGQQESHVSA